MDRYLQVYTQQLSPLIHFNGSSLEKEDGIILKNELERFNVSGKVWDDTIIKNRLSNNKFIVRSIKEPGETALKYLEATKTDGTHSPLSPFNAESKLFPNGILGDEWFTKYIEHVPFAYIKAFVLSETDEDDKSLIKEVITAKHAYQKFKIKFIPIFVSDSKDSSQVQNRMNEICKQSELMSATSYLYFSRGSETYLGDIQVSIQNLLTSLRTNAHTYYGDIAIRIKSRTKKYYSFPPNKHIETMVDMSPKFLEARNLLKQGIIDQFANPHSFEQGLRALERCHSLMIEIIYEIFDSVNESSSDHDVKLYSQFRTLTDVIAVHIVRGYFSLEEPVVALKKHRMHVENHISFLPPSNKTTFWLASQYEWLGDLMKQIPPTILNLERNFKSNNKNSKFIRYFGGIEFLGEFSYNIITKPSFVYLEAFNELNKMKTLPSLKGYYLKDLTMESLISHKLELLIKSVSVIPKEKESGIDDCNFFRELEMYLSWQIIEITAQKEHSFPDLIESLEKLSVSDFALRWTPLKRGLKLKLLEYYAKNKSFNSYLSTVLDLAILGNLNHEALGALKPEDVDMQKVICDKGERWFRIKPLMISNEDHKMVSAGCACYSQLEISFVVISNVLEKIFPTNKAIEAAIDVIELNYECVSSTSTTIETGFKRIVINNDSDSKKSFVSEISNIEEQESSFSASTNMSLQFPSDKVIRIPQQTSKPGLYQLSSVVLSSRIEIELDNKTITFLKDEEHNYKNDKSTRKNATIFKPLIGDNVTTQKVRCEDISDSFLMVVPLKPNIAFNLTNKVNNIFLGEKFSTPIEIVGVANNPGKVKYKSISINPNLRIVDENGETNSDFTLQVSWDDLKDDEALIVTSILEGDGETESHLLNLKVMISPAYFDKIKDKVLFLVADMKLIVTEDDTDYDPEYGTSTYDVARFKFRVLQNPFDYSFKVITEYDKENKAGLPCPFVIKGSELSTADHSLRVTMPISSRLWGVYLNIDDIWNLIKDDEIKVTNCDISIRSTNSDLAVGQPSDTSRCEEHLFKQLFTTENKNGFSNRNVNLLITGLIKWVRKDGKDSTFKTKDWEVTLPLAEPRLLLFPEKVSSNAYVLHYILENPTPRVLKFTTQMMQDDPEVSEWNFADPDNIVPLKQPPFPVMPYNRHIMEFRCTYVGDHNDRRVPDFKVIDIQYKVVLPVVPASRDLITRDNRLYVG